MFPPSLLLTIDSAAKKFSVLSVSLWHLCDHNGIEPTSTSMKSKSPPASIPFSITPEAEDYLRDRLKSLPSGAHAVLLMTMCQTDGLNPPRWTYEGQSFIFTFYLDSDEKTDLDSTEHELFGHQVAIESNALKQLSGRTLDLRSVAASRGLVNVSRYVLTTDSNSGQIEANANKSKITPSTIALTILGGFTGMGVAWLSSSMVVILFKISFEKILPLTFPVFAAGWIAGAIISFFFFKSVFKTNGRTRFAQQRVQQKYFGYTGPGADLDLWIFLGLPIPAAGILIFALEPFARTVGGKSAIIGVAIVLVFGVSMYFGDRLRRRWIRPLGFLGWALTFALGYWYFKTYGP